MSSPEPSIEDRSTGDVVFLLKDYVFVSDEEDRSVGRANKNVESDQLENRLVILEEKEDTSGQSSFATKMSSFFKHIHNGSCPTTNSSCFQKEFSNHR